MRERIKKEIKRGERKKSYSDKDEKGENRNRTVRDTQTGAVRKREEDVGDG